MHEQSHGELFLSILRHGLGRRGTYLLDEPESALSPWGQREAVTLLARIVSEGSQRVIATHSPIPPRLPGAGILQIDAGGSVEGVTYDECDPVRVTRQVLATTT